MKGALVCDPCFENHRTGSAHPEGPDRIRVIREGFQRVEDPPWDWLDPVAASPEQLHGVHPSDYVERVREASMHERPLDPDTPVSRESFETALLAAGSALALAESGDDRNRAGFAAVRPPGHHAEPSRGMGFCLFNNIALAADRMTRRGRRVAILDVDVHHGNGTQAAFYDRSDVLYVSTHQYPFYPGTGGSGETGEGEGEGYTLNIPLPAGSGRDRLMLPWKEAVAPAVESFDPDHIMVSAGFDAHRSDPLAGLNWTDEDYLRLADDIRRWIELYCEGRGLALLEGGYNRETLRRLVPRFVARLFASP